MENVPALLQRKFEHYLHETLAPLSGWSISTYTISATAYGIPQARTRVFIVGLLSRVEPMAVRSIPLVPPGARSCLGLPDSGYDAPAPTIRSGLTGPRKTTSILNSSSAVIKWRRLGLWPNGVAASAEAAAAFPTPDGTRRLSVDDVALLQGFPSDWRFTGPISSRIGQIGNSVSPPVAYAVATHVATSLAGTSGGRSSTAI